LKRFRFIQMFFLMSLLFMLAISSCNKAGLIGPGSDSDPVIVIETSLGNIFIQLYEKEAPIGTANFLAYVEDGFYTNSIFHRVMPGFVIQGGGYNANLDKLKTRAPIVNEATNGLRNLRGTLSYARTSDVNSATSQFFISLENNRTLDHRSNTVRGFGYAVFGKVVKGMSIVDKIAKVKTTTKKRMENVPVTPVIIEKAYVFEEE